MYVPHISRASETLLDIFGAYLSSRLKAHPETAGLLSVFEKSQTALNVANDTQRKARRGLQDALAAREYAEFLMDRLVSKFQLAVLAHVESDRTSALYDRYFPKGSAPHALISPVRQIERVKVFESDLAGAADAAPLKSWLPRLADQRIKLEKAIAAWHDAKVAHTEAQKLEITERSNWLVAYKMVHVDLLKLYATDRKKVESFFRRGRKPRTSQLPPESAAPAA